MRARRTARLGLALLSALLLAVSLSGCDPRTWLICSLGACGADYDQSKPLQPTPRRGPTSRRHRPPA